MDNKVTSRMHQPLRVPSGWDGQGRALVIQIEKLFDELYVKLWKLENTAVTDVAYDSENSKITRTINGATADVVSVSTIKSALDAFTWGQIANHQEEE